MRNRWLNKNFFVILGIDLFLLFASLSASYLIRMDFDIRSDMWGQLNRAIPLVLLIKAVIFYHFDLYRGMWRYTSISDLINVIKAATLSTLIVISCILFSNRFQGFSRTVFLIDWGITILFIAGFRLCLRVFFELASEERGWRKATRLLWQRLALQKRETDRKNLVIIGAGDCGEKILREIRNNSKLPYRVAGFLDDHPRKIKRKIHGVPVLHSIDGLSAVTEGMRVDEVVIAIPSATSQQMRRIVAICKESGARFRTVPNMGELINGDVSVKAIRDVAYRDLLGRETARLDEGGIGAYLKGQTVMVTGAGGSIGSELCKQIARFGPSAIVLYERAETPLYEIDLLLKAHFRNVPVVPVLGDILDRQQLEDTFSRFNPAVVFHAAAYKHVPMLELQPWKAVENNVIGTQNVVELAKRHSIDRFVLVSTDKAVRPTNVMGVSKRTAEILVQNQNSCGFSGTLFMIVRFGNVVGSAGSVVPLFKRQIAAGGPVTVTHRDVTRYFMTIPEASQLILQAGAMGEGGEIFILDMGTPVAIVQMAKDLIRLSGLELGRDIAIEYIGLRPGEKLYEELITEGEGIVGTGHEKIMVLKGTECNLALLNGSIRELAKLAGGRDATKIKACLRKIVPEYRPEPSGETENREGFAAVERSRAKGPNAA